MGGLNNVGIGWMDGWMDNKPIESWIEGGLNGWKNVRWPDGDKWMN